MTQRVSDANDFQKAKSAAQQNNEEEQTTEKIEVKGKGTNTATINIVKSKIRERENNQTHETEEEDTLGNLKTDKITNSKPSKYSRFGKKSKSKSNSISEVSENTDIILRPSENPTPEIKSENVLNSMKKEESNDSFTSSTISKNSSQIVDQSPIKENSVIIKNNEEARVNVVQPVLTQPSNNEVNGSNTLDSKEDAKPEQPPPIANSGIVLEEIDQGNEAVNRVPQTMTPEKPEFQRGNYMYNVAPAPANDYGPQQDEDPNKGKSQDQHI